MIVTEADDRARPSTTDVDVVDVEFVADDRSLAGLVRLDVRPAAGATRFLASVLRPGREPVTVLVHDLPLAVSAFEFRAPGVWVEFGCETPLDHWTIGLEAFGLAVPADEVVTPESFGERVPIGLDLDLDTVGAPVGDVASFAIDVRVHGEVLIDDAAYEIEATGVRRRARHPLRTPTIPDAGPLLGELAVAWPPEDAGGGIGTVERRAWFGGSRPGWTALAPDDRQSWV